VVVAARWDAESVAVTVIDDGPGLAPDILERIGEPYLTSRRRKGRGREGKKGEGAEEKTGLGLGVFIAKTLLQRTGARIHYRNRPGFETGAMVEVIWPIGAFSAPTSGGTSRLPEPATS
jgi:two-component system sensor histidine kinase RegB